MGERRYQDIGLRVLAAAAAPLILAQAPARPSQPAAVHAEMRSASVSVRDYPRAEARAGVGGRSEVEYEVGPNGRVRQCLIVRSSGSAALDARSCTIVRRFRFRPARDGDGRAVAQRWQTAFTWSPPADIALSVPAPVATRR